MSQRGLRGRMGGVWDHLDVAAEVGLPPPVGLGDLEGGVVRHPNRQRAPAHQLPPSTPQKVPLEQW